MSFGQYSYELTGTAVHAVSTHREARVKHVFPSDEVPHLWANGQDGEGIRAAGASISARNGEFYSYGTCIAVRAVDVKGELAFLVSENSHSISTSRHLSAVWRAIPYTDAEKYERGNVYEVPTRRGDQGYELRDHAGNVSRMVAAIASDAETALKARQPKRNRLLNESLTAYEKVRRYGLAFDVTVPDVSIFFTPEDVEKYRADKAEKQQLANIAYAARQVEITAKNAERALLQRADYEIALAKWMHRETLTWSEQCDLRSQEDAGLRIDGEEVETTQGARFPVAHARRGLALVRAVMVKGEEWKRNGHTLHLGHYQIDRVTVEGTVYAGCHTVTWGAIERITADLEDGGVSDGE